MSKTASIPPLSWGKGKMSNSFWISKRPRLTTSISTEREWRGMITNGALIVIWRPIRVPSLWSGPILINKGRKQFKQTSRDFCNLRSGRCFTQTFNTALSSYVLFCYLFVCFSRLRFWQILRWCGPAIPTHTFTKESHNTGNFVPYSSRILFLNVPHWTYEYGRYLRDGAYGLYCLSEKTWKSIHLQLLLQSQLFLLSYFKTLSVVPSRVELTTSCNDFDCRPSMWF